ncbi:MAG: hypothetical protein IH631_08360, partial [Candidatus Thorarchaeota archaeon]|nr:hypothetical protein [Candidatus Thorarchaeota archaeon]
VTIIPNLRNDIGYGFVALCYVLSNEWIGGLDVFDLDPVDGATLAVMVFIGLVMNGTLALLLPRVLLRLKPQHRFKLFETYALVTTLYFLCINTVMWVIFPEHILYILLYFAPIWVMVLLLAPVVYFKARNASDDSEIQANGQ